MKIKLLCCISLLPLLALAQTPITTSGTQYTPQQLITDVFLQGTGITATNITSSTGTDFGSVNGLGYFTSTDESFPLENGIILSTGDIVMAPGPNTAIQEAGSEGWTGDADVLATMLEADPWQNPISNNATKLEFDFVAISNQIAINYIFASEEYGNYQCIYGDAFIILLTDSATGVSTNLAVIPGTTIPVSVTTVNNSANNPNCTSSNPAFFGNYYPQGNAPAPINFNGQTVQMTAYAVLIPGHNYHLKFAIADRLDTYFDSALFIESINASGQNYVTFAGTPDTQYVCDTNSLGFAQFNLLENNSEVLGGQNPDHFTVAYFETMLDAENNVNAIENPEAYHNLDSYTQIIYARLSSNFYESHDVVFFPIVAAPQPFAGTPESVVVFDNNDDDIDGSAFVDMTTQESLLLDGLDPESFEITYYTSEVNAEAGAPSISVPQEHLTPSATFYFRMENIESGCYDTGAIEVIVLPSDYETPAPDGNEQQQFESGDTLADLDITGEDIQWYDTPGQAGPPTTADTDIPLPLSTVLVDGETYYASQTIYGIESVQRLAVTVHVTMGAGESIFENFTAFPNPVKDVLHISNNSSISNVAVYNLVGQLVQDNEVNAGTATINLHNLAKGIYIVSVQSGNAEKAIRIVKE